MVQLIVVGGDNKGSVYKLKEGKNSIGRQEDCNIVINSNQVSRVHAYVVVRDEQIVIADNGSTTGTFINGTLVSNKRLNKGDRITIGKVTLQVQVLSMSQAGKGMRMIEQNDLLKNNFQPPATGTYGPNALPAGRTQGQLSLVTSASAPAGFTQTQAVNDLVAHERQEGILGTILHYFEAYLMPVFYSANLHTEWKSLVAVLFGVYIMFNLGISILPLIDAREITVLRESSKRAEYMAKHLVKKNNAFVAERQWARTTIDQVDQEEGVVFAAIIDRDGLIKAPAERMNEPLSSGPISVTVNRALDRYRNEEEKIYNSKAGDNYVVSIYPIKVVDPTSGRNVVMGVAAVGLDISYGKNDPSAILMTYSKALVLVGILGILMYLIFIRLSTKPFEILNTDIDQILKGEMSQVTKTFKRSELDQLWDVINSALSRLPRAEGGATSASGELLPMGVPVEEVMSVLQVLGENGKFGLIIFDEGKRIKYLNSVFDEVSGLHLEQVLGQLMDQAASDQAFAAFFDGILTDAQNAMGASVKENFDYNGIEYSVSAMSLGSSRVSGYLVIMSKKESY